MYLDTRRSRPDGQYPLRIMLYHKGNTVSLPTDIMMTPEEWMSMKDRIGEVRTSKGRLIRNIRSRLDGALEELRIERDVETMTASEIKRNILLRTGHEMRDPERIDGQNFLAGFRRFMESRETEGTRRIYGETLRRIEAYASDAGSLRYDDITKDWLYGFDSFLAKGASASTRSRHLRNIRAVFNDAIDREVTNVYPFRKFRFPKVVETAKRSLSLGEVRMLKDMEVEPWQEEYRDMFLLMLYLIGINIGDLLHAEASQLHDGRLEYRRAKTHRLYSVKVEPEAMAIIERYRGERYLLSPLDRYASHLDYLHHLNEALQKIGPSEIVKDKTGRLRKVKYHPLFPQLTSYWARHTWATLAASLDIPVETISRALGHSLGSSVTNIYIRYDTRKTDRANRAVLDLIFG